MTDKLEVGDTLSKAFVIYAARYRVLLPAAFGVFLVVAVLSALSAGSAFLLVTAMVRVIATTFFQGMTVALLNKAEDEPEGVSAGSLVGATMPFSGQLILAGILIGFGLLVGIALVVIPALFLATIWAVVAPVIVVERKAALESLTRSRELVRGYGWQVFGVVLMVLAISFVVWIAFAALAAGLGDSTVARVVCDAIGTTITAPLSALVAALLYFRLRELHKAASLLHADED